MVNIKYIHKPHIILCAFLILALTLAAPTTPLVITLASDGSSYVYDGYIYDYWGMALESPSAYQVETVIDESNLGGMKLRGINDVCTSDDGRIFLVDTLESRIHVLDEEGNMLRSLKLMRNTENKIVLDEEGNQVMLNLPEGVFYHEGKKELYIADTGSNRVIVLDGETYAYMREYKEPENMAGVSEYKPSKIAVDHANRIYVVVQSSYEGIIELNQDGTFSRYYGVNVPFVNYIDQFWKSLASDAQKEKMEKTFAPAFNNVAIDGEGFVFAVTYDNSSADMVFRLNADGSNVLREMWLPVEGDFWYFNNEYSKFVDVAITDYGLYALLDKERGRVFLYNFDGELLNAFGSLGKLKGEFQIPTGIAFLNDRLIVTDAGLNCAYVLAPTDFGEAILGASEKYYHGRWDEALAYFEEAVRINANYEIGYTGIGKNYLMKDEYKTAMYYFKLGNNHAYYSRAYNGYRGEVIKKNFWIIAVVFIALISLIVVSEVKYAKLKIEN